MDLLLLLILAGAGALGFYMAWNIGSNDVANSMATAVGAKAITLKQAVLIAGVLNFAGAVFVGSHVTETIKGNIVNPALIHDSFHILLGFLASLLAASIFVMLSTWREMPVSTTHSVIGALIGFGLVESGFSCVNWAKFGEIAASWVLSPIIGAILAFLVFKVIVKLIFERERPAEAAKTVGPGMIGLTIILITSSLLMKTNLGEMLKLNLNEILIIALVCGIIGTIISTLALRRIKIKEKDEYDIVEGIFRKLQIATSCYVAFSQGANDVANAIGPVAGIISIATTGVLDPKAEVPAFLLAIGGIGIAIGCITWGYKVMRTLGYKITSLTNTRGFSIDFGAATTILLASKLGLPISTTHTVVGAVIGVGLARGLDAVDLSVVRKIVISWLVTVPAAACLSAVIFLMLRGIVGG